MVLYLLCGNFYSHLQIICQNQNILEITFFCANYKLLIKDPFVDFDPTMIHIKGQV
jgi:hypothetical protein